MLPEGFDRDAFIAGLRANHARILPSDIVFSVENGWLPLIAESLEQIEATLEGHGWIKKANIRQIKEKLGSLRISVRPRRESASYPKALQEELFPILNTTTAKSVQTCELCGDSGETGNFAGYLQTLCPKHSEQRRAWIVRGREGDVFHD
jgi:hypothetical protein